MKIELTKKDVNDICRILRERRNEGRRKISGGYIFTHNPDADLTENLLKKIYKARPRAPKAKGCE